jgi:Co/Zn/Cd efflux system component
LTGLGALAVNLSCALILTRFRRTQRELDEGCLSLSAKWRPANAAIIAAGLLTAYTLSVWPDLIVGLGIAAMNGDAAREER